MAKKLAWKFPQNHTDFLRVEIFFLTLLAILVFLYTSFQFERRIFSGLAFTLLFIIIYLFVAFGTKKLRKAEENYHIFGEHLHITSKRSNKTTKTKIHLKKVSHHKLDRLFLGGYLVTKQGKKYILFFNDKNEMDKFEKVLRKHLKPLKR
jgi:Ca2+/Na+ antiporter